MATDLFDIPSRHYIRLAKRHRFSKAGNWDEGKHPRDNEGQFSESGGGSSGGGDKPSSGSSGAFGRAVAAAGGVAAVAAVLAASGVPGVRNVPGLRQLRNKVLGFRTNVARQRAMTFPWYEAVVPVGRPGKHVRLQTEAMRTRMEPTELGRRLGVGRYKPSPAATRRYQRQGFFAPFQNPPNLRER